MKTEGSYLVLLEEEKSDVPRYTGDPSNVLRYAITLMTRTICSEKMDDLVNIQPLMASCLIPLDKSPGDRRKSHKIAIARIDRWVD